MKARANPDYTVLELVQAIQTRKPKEYPNLLRILAIVLPAVATADGNTVGEEPTPEGVLFASLASSIPASRLLDCLDKGGSHWAPWLIAVVPTLATIKSYKRDYRRCLARSLDHAVASGLLTESARGVAPAWQQARERLAGVLPYNQDLLSARLERGEIELYGRALSQETAEADALYFRTWLDSFNEFGRYMTGQGILDPRDVRPEHMYDTRPERVRGSNTSWYAYRMETAPDAMAGYSRARFAWEVLQQLEPDWQLVDWPRPAADKIYGLPRPNFPPTAEAMLVAIEKVPGLKQGTRENIQTALERLLGVLHLKLGVDVHALGAALYDPKDLGYLLLAGAGRADGGEPDPREEVERLVTDEAYRRQYIERARAINHTHAFRGACRRNPFLVLFSGWLIERNTASIAEVALKQFRIVGDRYLHVEESQRTWLGDMIKEAVDAHKLKSASKRAKRKQAVAMDETLWLKLVEARPRLAAHTAKMWLAMEETPAKKILDDPRATEKKKAKAKKQIAYASHRWAVAVRDELMVGLLLCFALRKENIQGMRRGVEIFPDEYRVSIPPPNAKAGEWINRHFPDAGPFADLKSLLDLYRHEARPLLLAGRGETPYLFLTVAKGQEARDEGGQLRGGREQLPATVRKICRKFFKDLLPPTVDVFNVHLIRDILAAYVYPKPGGEALASQALANTPEVTRKNYLQHHRQNDAGVRAFLEGEHQAVGKRGRTQALRGRKEFLQGFKQLLPDTAAPAIAAVMKLFDQHR